MPGHTLGSLVVLLDGQQAVETFYLGHGGPVTRESVVDAFPAAAASAAWR